MTKIRNGEEKVYASSKKNERHLLDTIQTTCDRYITESRVSQYYKGLRKKETNAKLVKIERIIEQLNYTDAESYKKKIERTRNCLNIALQDGDNLIQSRCNQSRLCQNCARAESRQRLEDYKHDLTNLATDGGLYFVTLTAPTCKQRELRATIDKRIKAFARVKNNIARRYGTKLNGLRKIEVTYNRESDKYHPHFHFLVQGKSEAHLLRDLWLNQFNDASIKAQDIRRIEVSKDNESNLIEVFKYATKGVVKDETDAHAEYHILRAIAGRRIFQTFGELKKVKPTDLGETEKAKIDWTAPNQEIYAYESKLTDWTAASGARLVNLDSNQVKQFKQKHDAKKNCKTDEH